MLEWAKMQIPGKEYLSDTALVTATTTGAYCWSLALSRNLTSSTQSFQLIDRFKTNWMHPLSKNWHMIDYALVPKRDLKDVIHTKVMLSPKCYRDHHLVRCKLRLHFKPKLGLQFMFENIDCPEDTSETLWNKLKSAILQTSEEVLGFTTKKNKDWSDENNREIKEQLAQKRSSHQAHMAQPSCHVSFAASSSASFKRSKMSSGPISQRELSHTLT